MKRGRERNHYLGYAQIDRVSVLMVLPVRTLLSIVSSRNYALFIVKLTSVPGLGKGGRGVHANLGNARILGASVTETPN